MGDARPTERGGHDRIEFGAGGLRHHMNQKRSSLDHMLCSTALFSKLASVRVDHSISPSDYSDHWPLIATFDLARNASMHTLSPPSSVQAGIVQLVQHVPPE